MEEPIDDERLCDLAASIADGASVDWDSIRGAIDPKDAAVVDQLRVLGDIIRVHAGQDMWGSLRLIEPIGQGSSGTVYRAFDAQLKREVALKIIRRGDGSGSAHARAVDEARRMVRIRHRNVVTVLAVEPKDGEIAVSMELITGKTLDQWVKEHGSFSARETMLIGIDVCRALAAVHGAGLLHGDIKAHNLMREEGGRIVLMDFSAGRDLDTPPAAQACDVAGTPLYLAPEVFQGKPRSRQSDIYSLGVLLFYLATGRYPIEGPTSTEINRQHQQTGRAKRLRDIRPDLPDAFIQVVERATSDVPANRYETAGAFEAGLKACLVRADKRNVGLYGAGATAAVALVMVLAGAAYWRSGGNDAAGVPPALPTASADPAEYRVDVAMYRMGADTPVRLQPDARLSPGDRLFLEVETSVTTYVYVVNEDERGESYLLFPLPGDAAPGALAAQRVHRLPGALNGEEVFWRVTSVGGREHFTIFVSPEPLPAFARVLDHLPRPSLGRQVTTTPLSADVIGVLRGVGGLTGAGRSTTQGTLTGQFATSLPQRAETARGLWVRQISLENSGR